MTNTEHRGPAAYPAGIVTEAVATITGPQAGTIDVHNAQTDHTTLSIRWGQIAMTFTSAEQVQHILGWFAMARQGMLGAETVVPNPRPRPDPHAVTTLIAITWSKTPDAVAHRTEMNLPAYRRTVKIVALKIGPVTFQILDSTGLASAIELLTRAHKTAIAAFIDGEDYRQDPTRISWRPKRARLATSGENWIPRRGPR